jgi:uncharacterized protein YcgI (DUF1989 family)
MLDEIIPAGAPWSGIVRRSQLLRFTDLHGHQVVDFLCYNAAEPEERYHAPNTMKAAGSIFLSTGHRLCSGITRPIFTIEADDLSGHDTIGGCCSAPSDRMLCGVEDCPAAKS